MNNKKIINISAIGGVPSFFFFLSRSIVARQCLFICQVHQQLRQTPFCRVIISQYTRERRIAQRLRQNAFQGMARASIVAQAQVAPHHMLEQPRCRFFYKLAYHVREHRRHRVEPLVRLANVVEPSIVHQDLLHDENGNGLGQLRARLHNAQAQRDDFGLQQEVNYVDGVVLDQRPNHAQRRQPQVLERLALGRCIQERVQKQGDMGVEKGHARAIVRRYTLQQGQRVAHSVRRRRRELRRRQERVHMHDFLDQAGHDSKRVPQNQGQVVVLLALLAQLQQGLLAVGAVHELEDPGKHLVVVRGLSG